ncbi:MAG: hypothetical protein HYZ53_28005 [Planctomycetes bacterium]|nr:hypothetical protein [Planctomycetota bacterium]
MRPTASPAPAPTPSVGPKPGARTDPGRPPRRRRLLHVAALALPSLLLALALRPPDAAVGAGPAAPQLWFFLPVACKYDAKVAEAMALIDRAAAAGYTGMVFPEFWLTAFPVAKVSNSYFANVKKIFAHAAARGVTVVPMIYPFGYSGAILFQDPNLAEPQRVVGTTFTVAPDGRSLVLDPCLSGPVDPGFELFSGHRLSRWNWQDGAGSRTFVDSSVSRTGKSSFRIDAGSGRGQAAVRLAVKPWRQYHVRFWLKTQELTGKATTEVADGASGRNRHFYDRSTVEFEPTQDWTPYEFAANSAESTTLILKVGLGGPSKGTAWFDDVSVTETALVNLIRRPGAPLRVYDAAGATYAEGTDVNPIKNPRISPALTFKDWQQPPTVTLPAGSRLVPGARVLLDYYAVAPVYGQQVCACLSEPAIQTYMTGNVNALVPCIPQGTGFLMNYDEMRQMNSCAACSAQNLTAGRLLGAHVKRSVATIRGAFPGAPLYVWSDMFDPNHNALPSYYLVEGSVAGSWLDLPSDVVVLNWNIGPRMKKSLSFFSQRGHRQIIAGYFDAKDGAKEAAREAAAAAGIDGVVGMMYTTWAHDYRELEAYANGARTAWAP